MFSVIIPTYNRPELITETVKCVQNQTLKPDEIIIINNGESKINYDLFSSKDNLTIINTVVKAGVSQARNIGVTVAKNKWIAFLDDDDLWELEYLEKAKKFIEDEKPDCLITRRDRLFREGIVKYKDFSKHEGNPLLLQKLLLDNFGVGGSNTIINKSVFIDIGGYNVKLDLAEDRSLVIECLLKGYNVRGSSSIQCITRMDMDYDRLTAVNKSVKGKMKYLEYYHELANSMDKKTKKRFNFLYYKYRLRTSLPSNIINLINKFRRNNWIKYKKIQLFLVSTIFDFK